LKSIISILLASSIAFVPISRAKANPAVLAPVAFCAGTAGVGCVLIGTVIVGGAVYYVWQTSNGHRVHADAKGQVLRSENRPGDSGEWDEPIGNMSKPQAQRVCEAKRKEYKMPKVRVERDPLWKASRNAYSQNKKESAQ
jgi:hypothetical protein